LKTFEEVELRFDPRQGIMQLDDNCMVDRGSERLRMYRASNREWAEKMGVRLTCEDNPSKAFPLTGI
jgi:hypothetical protein